MLAADWHPADAITLRSSLKIAESVVFDRPDPDAPVSALYVFGRKQDLAFEQDVGGSADQRHHVRWWRAGRLDGRPLWIGDAAFDRGAGISHLTGEITHHIAPDIDAERDYLMASLARPGGSPTGTNGRASAPRSMAATPAATATHGRDDRGRRPEGRRGALTPGRTRGSVGGGVETGTSGCSGNSLLARPRATCRPVMIRKRRQGGIRTC